jgi:hypothetical protein
MRETVLCTVAAAGATLLIASGAQAMPQIGPGLNPAVHQQTATQQVRCRGHRCSYVARPHYYVARPYARSYGQPSNAWEYSPLNNSYYWGGGAMGGGR